jgi:hypothetical protein
MHIARVVGKRQGVKVSERGAKEWIAFWQGVELIVKTKGDRHPSQTWRVATPDATPSAPADPTPAEPALLQAEPIDEARSKAIARKRKQGKKGGTNRLA